MSGSSPKAAIPDDRVLRTRVDVEHRSEGEVDPDRRELRADGERDALGERRVRPRGDRAHRRNREPGSAQAHDAPALLVDGDERRLGRGGADLARERGDSRRGSVDVGPEEDDAAAPPFLERPREGGRQRGAGKATEDHLPTCGDDTHSRPALSHAWPAHRAGEAAPC